MKKHIEVLDYDFNKDDNLSIHELTNDTTPDLASLIGPEKTIYKKYCVTKCLKGTKSRIFKLHSFKRIDECCPDCNGVLAIFSG